MENMDFNANETTDLEETELTEEDIDTADAEQTTDSEKEDVEIDYAELVREDLRALKGAFPELATLRDISELENPLRYAALRDLGLSCEEAYLATTKRRVISDNRSHLLGGVPRAAKSPRGTMSDRELSGAREIFSDLSDAEIRNLYKKVTI
jgi:hypothetical protein